MSDETRVFGSETDFNPVPKQPRAFEAMPYSLGDHRTIRGIYGLADPRTGRVMYVGQSVDVEYRYRQHCHPKEFRESNRAKAAWVNELAEVGLAPKLLMIVDCGTDRETGVSPEMDAAEISTIRAYKVLGEAEFNIAGGVGGSASVTANSHPDDWHQLGLEIKRVRAALFEVALAAGRLGGNPCRKKGQEAVTVLDRVAWMLEGRMKAVYPEWADVTRVFSGPIDGPPLGCPMKPKPSADVLNDFE